MTPEDVNSEWVEKAAEEIVGSWDGNYVFMPTAREMARDALAAVLPDIKNEVRSEIIERIEESFDHAYGERDENAYEFAYAEGYRHRDRQVRTILDNPWERS